jgi:hypothetical protein
MAPDGRTLVSSLGDKVKAWNIVTGQQTPLPGLPADMKAAHAHFAADGKTLVAIHANMVTLLDWPVGKVRRRFTLPEPAQKPGEAHCDAAGLSPNGRWLATLAHRSWHRDERGMRFGFGSDGVLDLWNATTGERVHRLADDGRLGRTARFTADGNLLCDVGGKLHPLGGGEGDAQGEFSLIDPLTGRLKQSFEFAPVLPGASHRYNATMGIAPDGRAIFCAGNDGVIHIYETATGKIRRSLTRHRDYVSGLAFTGDGRRLLSASSDLTCLVWDISLAGFNPKRPMPRDADELVGLWDKLLDTDAKTAYTAMATVAADPKIATGLIRARLRPAATSPDDATLDRLIAELGDQKFAVRERATRELDQLGESAVAGMRARLAKPQPLETHRRLVRFLNKRDPGVLTPAHLREIRALEILEQLDTWESRAALTELAKGAPNARLTRASAASLARSKAAAANGGK